MTTTTIAGQPGDLVPAALDPAAGDLDAPVENLVEGVQLRSIVFPVAGPVTYSDDFGNCRDLCDRRHAGNDIVGLRLQPLVAAADGVVDHLVDNHPTAGWGVVVRDTEGWEYRYFHLNNDTPGTDDGLDDGTWRFAPGVGPGVAVQAGQILGWMGDSGNSESSVPHLHFEIRRPDGKAVNPFASLRWAQRLQQCLSPNGPFADMLFPIPEPAHEVELALPAGSLLIDHLGLSFPRGRSWVVGDPRFHAVDGACPAPGALIAPPIAATIVVAEDLSAG
ncbi:MAG TPA: M23 family metallopeptidase [Ilumatobacteraceae bacterium]